MHNNFQLPVQCREKKLYQIMHWITILSKKYQPGVYKNKAMKISLLGIHLWSLKLTNLFPMLFPVLFQLARHHVDCVTLYYIYIIQKRKTKAKKVIIFYHSCHWIRCMPLGIKMLETLFRHLQKLPTTAWASLAITLL